MSEHITKTIEDGIQTLTLARPEKKNALTQAMYQTLSDALEAGDQNPDVKVHVLLGVEGIFTAGNDIKDFLAHATGSDDGAGLTHVLRFIKLLPNVQKPILAGVDGAAIGIGTTLLLHCDMVFATPRSNFATPFLDLGLVPEAGSSLLMPRRMGYACAFEMLVMGEAYTAEQMQAAGVVNKIVASEDLEGAVMGAAAGLANKPQEAVRLSRQLMRGDTAEINTCIDQEAEIFAKRLSSNEAQAAFQAFLTKGSS